MADDEEELDNAFQKVVGFCLRDNNTNCFLVDKNFRGKEADLIHQLVDLKLLHLARSRVTVRTRPGTYLKPTCWTSASIPVHAGGAD